VDREGRPIGDVLAQLGAAQGADPEPHGGHLFGLTYPSGRADLEELAHAVYRRALYSNALNPLRYPEQARLIAQVVAWTGELVGLPAGGGGTATSGGTESILMAMLVHRERARARGVRRPVIVAPVTAHPAYAKAAHYFDMELRQAPVDPVTLRADATGFAPLVDERTAVVVASAYSYPHGVLDDVTGIAAIADAHGAGCHVDACVGGMVLPFAASAGVRDVPPWTFDVPGVTSMSVDLHKYGYVPKGISVVLHRAPDWEQQQSFEYDRWPGGRYRAPAAAGARSAAPALTAWAVMSYLGRAGYQDIVTELLVTTDRFRAGIEGVAGLRINGDPIATILSWRSVDPALDAYALGGALVDRGWFVNRLSDYGGCPAGLHVMVSPAHRDTVSAFATALTAAASEVRGGAASGAEARYS
jgi:glutamate/tyrosine decarboxylase-like PLP-dependent enzyme